MKSLRQLNNELIGIRLDATNVSLWQVQAELAEYGRTAINDAIAAFPVDVEVVEDSLMPIGSSPAVVVLPKEVRRVTQVVCGGSELLHWEYKPTPTTALVHIYDTVTTCVSVWYTVRQPPMPKDVTIAVDSIGSVQTSAANLAWTWPAPPAYVEFSVNTGGAEYREVAMYRGITATGFTGLVRGIEGKQTVWPAGSNVSLCYYADDRYLRPVMLLSQAVMYEGFLRHRALYDQYTAIASMQQLGLDEVQMLIRDLEARANLAYHNLRKGRLPAPVRGQRARPLPR